MMANRVCVYVGLGLGLAAQCCIRKYLRLAAARSNNLIRPGILCDLLWADLNHTTEGWGHNDRGVSFTFDEVIVQSFLKAHDLDLMVRAHEVVEDGYEFFANRHLVTIFSAPNYCGLMNNAGGVMSVSQELLCSFVIIQPRHKCKVDEEKDK